MGAHLSDVRHAFSAGGTFDAPLGLRFSPLIFASSGRPFNITTGADANEDSVFMDRPAFALDLLKPGIRITRFGAFDPAPEPEQPVIPRTSASVRLISSSISTSAAR